MDQELKMKALSQVVNRSKPQLEFLLGLCDGEFDRLLLLEQKIKENCLSYCPGTKEGVDEILNKTKLLYPWKDVYKEYMITLLKLTNVSIS